MSAWTDAADEDTLAAEHAHEAEAARVLRAREDSLRLVTEQRDEALAEADNLRNHLRAMRDDVARADALAIILDGAREGLARSGSKARAVQQVADGLRAQVVRDAVEAQRDRSWRLLAREDRGQAASQSLTVAALERDLREVRAELARVTQERDDAQVRALREAADAWQQGQWGLRDLRVQRAIGVAQDVTDWLRARADEIEREAGVSDADA